MTQTISAPDTRAAGSPQLPRPRTDADALRAIDDATEHVPERVQTLIAVHEMAKQQLEILTGQDRVALLNNFASHDMPGRQAHSQDCVDEILVKVSGTAAAS
jgi:hypothetical protein